MVNKTSNVSTLSLQAQHQQKQNPKVKKKAKNGPEKSTRKFYTVCIKYKKTHQNYAQLKEPANSSVKETK